MIRNEKYKGDILLGKTFTTDPISKRRLANFGEENQYYIRDHHEPIVSREVWDEAERIRLKRARNIEVAATGSRERYTRQYSFSSMCECAFCGHKLTRRTRHSSSVYEKPIWQCMNATKNGIANCPNCKAIDEVILEGAFVDAFKLLAGNFDDVLDVVLAYVEESANSDDNIRKRQQIEKDISSLESKKSRMTDMLIDGTITKEVYDEKLLEFTRKLHKLSDNGMLTNEEVIEELLKMAQQIRDAHEAGDELGLSEDELAFYDALTKPQAIKDFYENDELIAITKELTEALRKNRSIDWQKRDSARAKMRMMIKRLLKKHKYLPEGMDDAVATVMLQCELWTDNNDMDRRVVSYDEAFNKKSQDLQMVAEEPAPYGTKKED
jgi:hypothetical protein